LSKLKILNEILAEDAYGIIVDKGNKDLLKIINKVIDKLKNEGKIDKYILEHSSR
jgi:polar amino acid transport system substrate-binding protein